VKTGRNEPCYCGSGKKYKHCCLGKREPFGNMDAEPAEPYMTPYKFDRGINEYLAGLFDLLRQELEGSATDSENVKRLLGEIRKFSAADWKANYADVTRRYLKAVENLLHLKGADESQFHISMLNARRSVEGDVSHRQTIVIKIINDIVRLVDSNLGNPAHDPVSALLTGIAIDLLTGTKYEIPPSVQHPLLEVFVNNDGELIDYRLTGNSEDRVPGQAAAVRMTRLEELEAYDVVRDMYPKLSERGRIFLSTAEILYENVSSVSHTNFDYAVYCTNYFKCVEYELNDRVSEIIRGKFQDMRSGDLTLGSFVRAFKKELDSGNRITGLQISREFVENLERIKNIRNKANHVGVISLEECRLVREIVIEKGLIGQICELNSAEKNILYCSAEDKKKNFGIVIRRDPAQ